MEAVHHAARSSRAGICAVLFAFAVSQPACPDGSVFGVANLYCVNQRVYRGAQPTGEGLRNLARHGIKTIVDLRGPHSDWERRAATALGMRYFHIPLNAHRTPTEKEVRQVLGVLNTASYWPVFVHCRTGDDRTGMVLACYRIMHDHWTRQKALAEARSDAGRKLTLAMERYIRHFSAPGATQEAVTLP